MASRLADALVEGDPVTRDAVARAEACRRDHGGRPGSALVALGLVDARRLAELLGRLLRVPVVDADRLEPRGVEYIDPVPLVSPEQVPPPAELAAHLHFNDWLLAFARGRAGAVAPPRPA